MSYDQREALKEFALRGENLKKTLMMLSHWMSSGVDVTFSGYASNWAAANCVDDVAAIRRQWPLNGPRMITDNLKAWGSAIPNRLVSS